MDKSARRDLSEVTRDKNTDHAASRVENALARHDQVLRRFLKRALRHHEDVEDVRQEIYVRLLNREKQGAGEDYPRSYLFVTATNIIRDLRRKEHVRAKAQRDPILALAAKYEDIDPQPSAEVNLVWKEGLEIVVAALAEMKPNYATIFRMRWGDGLTFPEISKQTGIPVRTAERYASHALAHCRRSLQERNWQL